MMATKDEVFIDTENIQNFGLTIDPKDVTLDFDETTNDIMEIFSDPLANMSVFDDTDSKRFILTPRNKPSIIILRIKYEGKWDLETMRELFRTVKAFSRDSGRAPSVVKRLVREKVKRTAKRPRFEPYRGGFDITRPRTVVTDGKKVNVIKPKEVVTHKPRRQEAKVIKPWVTKEANTKRKRIESKLHKLSPKQIKRLKIEPVFRAQIKKYGIRVPTESEMWYKLPKHKELVQRWYKAKGTRRAIIPNTPAKAENQIKKWTTKQKGWQIEEAKLKSQGFMLKDVKPAWSVGIISKNLSKQGEVRTVTRDYMIGSGRSQGTAVSIWLLTARPVTLPPVRPVFPSKPVLPYNPNIPADPPVMRVTPPSVQQVKKIISSPGVPSTFAVPDVISPTEQKVVSSKTSGTPTAPLSLYQGTKIVTESASPNVNVSGIKIFSTHLVLTTGKSIKKIATSRSSLIKGLIQMGWKKIAPYKTGGVYIPGSEVKPGGSSGSPPWYQQPAYRSIADEWIKLVQKGTRTAYPSTVAIAKRQIALAKSTPASTSTLIPRPASVDKSTAEKQSASVYVSGTRIYSTHLTLSTGRNIKKIATSRSELIKGLTQMKWKKIGPYKTGGVYVPASAAITPVAVPLAKAIPIIRTTTLRRVQK